MCALHWLPVVDGITYKLCLLMHHIHNGEAPVYLADIVTATSDMESRSGLRSSSSDRYEIPRSRLRLGERRFAVAGPRAWTSLLAHVSIRSTVKGHLKSVLFQRAYTSWCYLIILYCICFYLIFNCSLLVMLYVSKLL